MKKLFPLLLVLPVLAAAATSLKLPEGFVSVSADTTQGGALFSKQTVTLWEKKDGVAVRFWMDDSNRVSNGKIIGYAGSMVEQMAKQAKAHYETGESRVYTIRGKHWVVTPFTARDPGNKPDMVILLTEFDKSIGLIQVGAKRTQVAALKEAWPQIMRLNSPAESK